MPPVGKYIIFIYLCIFFIAATINVFSIKGAWWYLDNLNIFKIYKGPVQSASPVEHHNMSISPAAFVI